MDALDKLIADLRALRDKHPSTKFKRMEMVPVYEPDTMYGDGTSSGHMVVTVTISGTPDSVRRGNPIEQMGN